MQTKTIMHQTKTTYSVVADSGEGPEGPRPPPPLFLDETEEKILFDTAPPYLRVWMTTPPPPPPSLSEGLDLLLQCRLVSYSWENFVESLA